MRQLWRWFKARFRIDPALVCEYGAKCGPRDDPYHDYADSVEGYPDHFVPLTCARCGKQFYI